MSSDLYGPVSRVAKDVLPIAVQRPIKCFLDFFRDRKRASEVQKLVRVVEWEEPACAICGSRSVLPHTTYNGFKIVRCIRDGLIFASPRPKDLTPFYDHRYYTGDMLCGYSNYEQHAEQSLAEWELRLASIEQAVGRRGRLLDVGCATGVFLNHARRRGWDVSGIELGVWPAKVAREQFGLQVVRGSLPDSRLPPAAFDAVTLFDCIEHVAFPAEVLGDVRRILHPRGVVMISTGAVPHEDPGLISRWYYPPWHLYNFSELTIRALLAECGFSVLSYSETTGDPGVALMVVLAHPCR